MAPFPAGLTYSSESLLLCTAFVDQILDNCDGKQARKTGNSSTLGLLMDHGCDTLNAVINTITFLHFFSCSGIPFYVSIFAISYAFFLPTLQQLSYQLCNWPFGSRSYQPGERRIAHGRYHGYHWRDTWKRGVDSGISHQRNHLG